MMKLLDVTFYFKTATDTAIIHGLCNELLKIIDKMDKRFIKVSKDGSSGSSAVNSNVSSKQGSLQGSPRMESRSSSFRTSNESAKTTISSLEIYDKTPRILSANNKLFDFGNVSPDKVKSERHLKYFLAKLLQTADSAGF